MEYEKKKRMWVLIQKEIAETLTSAEKKELFQLKALWLDLVDAGEIREV